MGRPIPSVLFCVTRRSRGHYSAFNIVPEELIQIPKDQYVALLREFDSLIAEPAALEVGGMTAMETDKRTLEDYFSPEAVRLLETFCKTSNVGDLGSHPSDQEKWMAFLLHAYRDGAKVHCDVFGECLKARGWWPEKYIDRLVHEYDFAMRLLRHAETR